MKKIMLYLLILFLLLKPPAHFGGQKAGGINPIHTPKGVFCEENA